MFDFRQRLMCLSKLWDGWEQNIYVCKHKLPCIVIGIQLFFCITDLTFNDSLHKWKVIQAYFLGNASSQSLIDHLHDNIGFTIAKSFSDSDVSTIAHFFGDKNRIRFQGIFKIILHTSRGIFIVIILMLLLFLIMYQFCIQPYAENLHTLWWELLLASNKN